ncbi:MAG: APC family permease [Gemmataceae bacterium]|nr:APC family permease [Gemmataceae bacterium]
MGFPQTDEGDLARAGYRPAFRRRLGAFAAFAAGFSYLSILTGVVQNFYLGYGRAGPAFVWTWPVVFLGQLCLALCFAHLAREYPLCGGVYAWSRRAGSAAGGWLTGWVYLVSLVVTLAAVALAWQVVLPAVWAGFQLVESTSQNAVLLGAGLIVISTLLNTVGNRWLPAVMTAGAVAELAAAVVLIVLLGLHAVRGPEALFETTAADAGDGLGIAGAFLAAAVMAAYVMYGFDTAGALAEETVRPRERAPRAILQALLAAGGLGFLLLVAAILAAPDPADPRLGDVGGGLPHLIKQVLGGPVGSVFVGASVVAVFVCALAVQALAARVLFAMARDRAIPGWRRLGRVHPRHGSPDAASLAVGAVAAGLLVVNWDYESVMTAVVCVSIVWANLAYLFTTAPLLWHRLFNRGSLPPDLRGRWGTLANFVAVVWGAALIVNVGWPRASLYGEAWYQQYAAPILTAGLLLAGGLVYWLVWPAAPTDRRDE